MKCPDIWFSFNELGFGMLLAFILGLVFGTPVVPDEDDSGW